MSRKPRIQTEPLQPTTQLVIWAGSSWAQPLGQSLRTGADIGGRHTPMGGTTIRTRRPTAGDIITGVMVIIMQRLTITLQREPMAGNRLLMAHTGRQRAELLITLTPGLTPEAPAFRPLTAAKVPHRPITPTPEPTLRRDKVRIQTRNGVALTSPEGTTPLTCDITHPPMHRWQAFQAHREERLLLRAPPGGTVQLAKLRAAICTPGMMAMFTRTPVTVGRNMTTETGIR